MNQLLPIVYLARHGETEWTLSGQYTGVTDLSLTQRGEHNARRLAGRLRGLTFAKVFTSPLQRTRRTCELAGFGPVAEIDRDLVEWNYGEYEGRHSAEIHREHPDWMLFRDGGPGGESPNDVGARRTVRSNVFARSRVTFCFFPAAISCGCSLPVGLVSSQLLADSFC